MHLFVPILITAIIANATAFEPNAAAPVSIGFRHEIRASSQETTARLNEAWTQGFTDFESGEYAKAKKNIEIVIDIVPFEPSSRVLLARCLAKMNDQNGALTCLEKAADLGWENFETVTNYPEFKAFSDDSRFQALLRTMKKNRERPYLLHVGKSVDRSKPAPIVILYHGRGELPHVQMHFWKSAADSNGWLVLALKGTRNLGAGYSWEQKAATNTWQTDNKAIFESTTAHLKQLSQKHKISQVVLAGFSQGGVAAFEMLRAKLMPRPAGAVIFATAFPENATELTEANASMPQSPILAFVGRNDPWHLGNQAMAKALANRGVSFQLQVWDDLEHQMPPDFESIITASVKKILHGHVPKNSD